jgi:putative endonuclease
MYFVYILTSRYRGTLYVGVTNDLARRVYEHRVGAVDGFTKKYSVKTLVYYEMHADIEMAIRREKLIKKWRRVMKFETIEAMNPAWSDLYEALNQ